MLDAEIQVISSCLTMFMMTMEWQFWGNRECGFIRAITYRRASDWDHVHFSRAFSCSGVGEFYLSKVCIKGITMHISTSLSMPILLIPCVACVLPVGRISFWGKFRYGGCSSIWGNAKY